MPIELSELPTELLTLIVERIHDSKDCRALCLTSSQFRSVAEAVLYRQILIRTGAICTKVLNALSARPERAQLVQSVELRGKYRHEIGLQDLPNILLQTPNVRDLIIESPTCNYQHWRNDGNWAVLMPLYSAILDEAASPPILPPKMAPPLRSLRGLTLHWNGINSRYWDSVPLFRALFCNLSVEELTISCATVPDTLVDLAKKIDFRTPMKRLTLIECNVTHDGLQGILRMPKALEYLYLGTRLRHISQMRLFALIY